jgi:hypothetical protein
MFSNNNYKTRIFKCEDFFDGIMTFIYLILIVKIGFDFKIDKLDYLIFIDLILIIIFESLINLGKIIFILSYQGTDDDYELIKNKIFIIISLLSLPIISFSIYVLIIDIYGDFYSLCNIFIYVVLSSCRIFNSITIFL